MMPITFTQIFTISFKIKFLDAELVLGDSFYCSYQYEESL